MALTTIFEGDVTDSSTVAEMELGTIVEFGGKKYRYVQAKDLALADGDIVEVASASDPNVVTKDRSGGSSIGRVPRGVAVGVIAANSYGFVQISGYKSNVKADGSIAAASGIVPHATSDGVGDSVTASTTAMQVIGFALAADTTSRVQAMLTIAE